MIKVTSITFWTLPEYRFLQLLLAFLCGMAAVAYSHPDNTMALWRPFVFVPIMSTILRLLELSITRVDRFADWLKKSWIERQK